MNCGSFSTCHQSHLINDDHPVSPVAPVIILTGAPYVSNSSVVSYDYVSLPLYRSLDESDSPDISWYGDYSSVYKTLHPVVVYKD